jgi:hypothetical protein
MVPAYAVGISGDCLSVEMHTHLSTYHAPLLVTEAKPEGRCQIGIHALWQSGGCVGEIQASEINVQSSHTWIYAPKMVSFE